MKNNVFFMKVALPVLGLGGIGMVLRRLMYSLTVDEKNLLPAKHPLQTVLWVVTLAAVVWILVGIRNQKRSGQYRKNFRASIPGAVSSAALAVGILVTVLEGGLARTGMERMRDLLGLVASAALLGTAYCRWKGSRPFFPAHGVVCVYFAIFMVSSYQGWSSNPQIQDYVFSLLASIGLMLFSYHQACFDVDAGNCRMQLGLGLLTAFCCFVALSGTQSPILYLTGGIWCACNLCNPQKRGINHETA